MGALSEEVPVIFIYIKFHHILIDVSASQILRTIEH